MFSAYNKANASIFLQRGDYMKSPTTGLGKFISGGKCWVWKGQIIPRPPKPPAADSKNKIK